MKIEKSDIVQNQKLLKQLSASQRREVAHRETELKNLDKFNKLAVEDKKFQGEARLTEIQGMNDHKVLGAIQDKENRLNDLKVNLKGEETRLAKERELLALNNSAKVQQLNVNHENKFRENFDRAEEKTKKLNHLSIEQTKDLNAKSDRSLSDLQYKTKLKLDTASHKQDTKLQRNSQELGEALERKKVEYSTLVSRAGMEHQRKLNELNSKNTSEIKEKEKISKNSELVKTEHEAELIKQKTASFKQKIKNLDDEHKKVFDLIKTRYDKELDSLVQNHSKDKASVMNKATDSFYSVERMTPVIVDNIDHYQISIKTPEHEKENYVLSVNKRKIKLSMTRRMEERIDGVNGNVDNTRKSEAYTKELKVADIMDNHKITQKWADGMLTYKVLKA